MRAGDWHVVQQGESVDSIAVCCGHLPETIWEAPENRDLKRQRKDPHILMPGDRIFLPPLKQKTASAATGGAHAFTVTRPRSRLRVQIVEAGQPRADAPFELEVEGRVSTGKTDGSGWVDQPVPPLALQARLTVGEPGRTTTYALQLRGLDPVSEVSGAQARLRNLGYQEVPLDGKLGPATAAALGAFQRDHGLSVTGSLDGPTQDTLKSQHGS
jgi:hypothetical protein